MFWENSDGSHYQLKVITNKTVPCRPMPLNLKQNFVGNPLIYFRSILGTTGGSSKEVEICKDRDVTSQSIMNY